MKMILSRDFTKKDQSVLTRSNQELHEFTYIVSHDLQEPLRKIIAFGDRLKTVCRNSINEQGLDYLARLLSAAARRQTLIYDLLDYSL